MEFTREYDPAALERVRDLGGPGLVRRLVSLVLETTPRRVSDARASLTRGDLAGVAFAAHALRSSAGNAGELKVQDLAGVLEREARAGHPSSAAWLTEQLEEAAVSMQQRLSHYVEHAA